MTWRILIGCQKETNTFATHFPLPSACRLRVFPTNTSSSTALSLPINKASIFPNRNLGILTKIVFFRRIRGIQAMGRKRNSPVNVLFGWVRRQSMKVKVFLGVTTVLSCLVMLKLAVRNYDHFFVAAEAIHAAGILVLVYKLITQKTCSGLSLKTQELTAMFLVVRLICSSVMEKDIHTVLDFAALVASLWVIYMIRFKLKYTYIKQLDNMPLYYLAVPCAVLALLVKPHTSHHSVFGMLWAFCVYLEAISVYPQLRLMQNAKMVEPFTAHYVFALGAARFLGFAHWVLVVYETGGTSLFLRGSSFLWLPAILISEIVQTFILADFCYYYVKSAMYGQLLTRLPSPV